SRRRWVCARLAGLATCCFSGSLWYTRSWVTTLLARLARQSLAGRRIFRWCGPELNREREGGQPCSATATATRPTRSVNGLPSPGPAVVLRRPLQRFPSLAVGHPFAHPFADGFR